MSRGSGGNNSSLLQTTGVSVALPIGVSNTGSRVIHDVSDASQAVGIALTQLDPGMVSCLHLALHLLGALNAPNDVDRVYLCDAALECAASGDPEMIGSTHQAAAAAGDMAKKLVLLLSSAVAHTVQLPSDALVAPTAFSVAARNQGPKKIEGLTQAAYQHSQPEGNVNQAAVLAEADLCANPSGVVSAMSQRSSHCPSDAPVCFPVLTHSAQIFSEFYQNVIREIQAIIGNEAGGNSHGHQVHASSALVTNLPTLALLATSAGFIAAVLEVMASVLRQSQVLSEDIQRICHDVTKGLNILADFPASMSVSTRSELIESLGKSLDLVNQLIQSQSDFLADSTPRHRQLQMSHIHVDSATAPALTMTLAFLSGLKSALHVLRASSKVGVASSNHFEGHGNDHVKATQAHSEVNHNDSGHMGQGCHQLSEINQHIDEGLQLALDGVPWGEQKIAQSMMMTLKGMLGSIHSGLAVTGQVTREGKVSVEIMTGNASDLFVEFKDLMHKVCSVKYDEGGALNEALLEDDHQVEQEQALPVVEGLACGPLAFGRGIGGGSDQAMQKTTNGQRGRLEEAAQQSVPAAFCGASASMLLSNSTIGVASSMTGASQILSHVSGFLVEMITASTSQFPLYNDHENQINNIYNNPSLANATIGSNQSFIDQCLTCLRVDDQPVLLDKYEDYLKAFAKIAGSGAATKYANVTRAGALEGWHANVFGRITVLTGDSAIMSASNCMHLVFGAASCTLMAFPEASILSSIMAQACAAMSLQISRFTTAAHEMEHNKTFITNVSIICNALRLIEAHPQLQSVKSSLNAFIQMLEFSASRVVAFVATEASTKEAGFRDDLSRYLSNFVDRKEQGALTRASASAMHAEPIQRSQEQTGQQAEKRAKPLADQDVRDKQHHCSRGGLKDLQADAEAGIPGDLQQQFKLLATTAAGLSLPVAGSGVSSQVFANASDTGRAEGAPDELDQRHQEGLQSSSSTANRVSALSNQVIVGLIKTADRAAEVQEEQAHVHQAVKGSTDHTQGMSEHRGLDCKSIVNDGDCCLFDVSVATSQSVKQTSLAFVVLIDVMAWTVSQAFDPNAETALRSNQCSKISTAQFVSSQTLGLMASFQTVLVMLSRSLGFIDQAALSDWMTDLQKLMSQLNSWMSEYMSIITHDQAKVQGCGLSHPHFSLMTSASSDVPNLSEHSRMVEVLTKMQRELSELQSKKPSKQVTDNPIHLNHGVQSQLTALKCSLAGSVTVLSRASELLLHGMASTLSLPEQIEQVKGTADNASESVHESTVDRNKTRSIYSSVDTLYKEAAEPSSIATTQVTHVATKGIELGLLVLRSLLLSSSALTVGIKQQVSTLLKSLQALSIHSHTVHFLEEEIKEALLSAKPYTSGSVEIQLAMGSIVTLIETQLFLFQEAAAHREKIEGSHKQIFPDNASCCGLESVLQQMLATLVSGSFVTHDQMLATVNALAERINVLNNDMNGQTDASHEREGAGQQRQTTEKYFRILVAFLMDTSNLTPGKRQFQSQYPGAQLEDIMDNLRTRGLKALVEQSQKVGDKGSIDAFAKDPSKLPTLSQEVIDCIVMDCCQQANQVVAVQWDVLKALLTQFNDERLVAPWDSRACGIHRYIIQQVVSQLNIAQNSRRGMDLSTSANEDRLHQNLFKDVSDLNTFDVDQIGVSQDGLSRQGLLLEQMTQWLETARSAQSSPPPSPSALSSPLSPSSPLAVPSPSSPSALSASPVFAGPST